MARAEASRQHKQMQIFGLLLVLALGIAAFLNVGFFAFLGVHASQELLRHAPVLGSRRRQNMFSR